MARPIAVKLDAPAHPVHQLADPYAPLETPAPPAVAWRARVVGSSRHMQAHVSAGLAGARERWAMQQFFEDLFRPWLRPGDRVEVEVVVELVPSPQSISSED